MLLRHVLARRVVPGKKHRLARTDCPTHRSVAAATKSMQQHPLIIGTQRAPLAAIALLSTNCWDQRPRAFCVAPKPQFLVAAQLSNRLQESGDRSNRIPPTAPAPRIPFPLGGTISNPRQRRMIAERYAKGETMAALASEFGVGEATVWRALRAEG